MKCYRRSKEILCEAMGSFLIFIFLFDCKPTTILSNFTQAEYVKSKKASKVEYVTSLHFHDFCITDEW